MNPPHRTPWRCPGAILAASTALWIAACSGAGEPDLLPPADGPIPLTGTIHDEQNRPLADAEISLYRLLGDLERARLELSGRQWPEPVATASVGPGGSFRLTAPGPGNYVAVARAPGRVPMDSPLWPLLEATDVGIARLFPDLGWRVRVVDAQGAPVPGAAVAAWGRGDWPAPYGPGLWRRQQRQVGGTDSRGEVRFFRLEGEPFRLGAVESGRFVRLDQVQPEEYGDEPVVVTLEQGAPRRIEVRLPDGSPATETVAYGVALVPMGITGPDGSFELRSRVPKSFEMGFVSPGGLVGEVSIEPVRAARQAPLRVVLKPKPVLVGRVVSGTSGRPVPGAWVMETSLPTGRVLTDRDGEFRLPVRNTAQSWVSIDAVGHERFSGRLSQDPLRRDALVLRLERRAGAGPVVKRYGWPEDEEE